MAEVERRMAAAPATTDQQQADIDNLPALLGRLGDNVMQLVDTKLSLVKVELKEDASFYARNGALTAVGGVIAAHGFALVTRSSQSPAVFGSPSATSGRSSTFPKVPRRVCDVLWL